MPHKGGAKMKKTEEKMLKEELIETVTELLEKDKTFNITLSDTDHMSNYGLIAISPFSDYHIDFITFGSYDNGNDHLAERGCFTVGPSADENRKQLVHMLMPLPDLLSTVIDDEDDDD